MLIFVKRNNRNFDLLRKNVEALSVGEQALFLCISGIPFPELNSMYYPSIDESLAFVLGNKHAFNKEGTFVSYENLMEEEQERIRLAGHSAIKLA